MHDVYTHHTQLTVQRRVNGLSLQTPPVMRISTYVGGRRGVGCARGKLAGRRPSPGHDAEEHH